MRRLAPLILLVTVLLLGFAASAGAAAVPYDAPGECLECHAAGAAGSSLEVAFASPQVDYASCRGCHAGIETSYLHEHSGDCASCHYVTGSVSSALYSTSYGKFKGASSLAASARDLHVIHSNPTRQDQVWGTGLGCQRCHAPVACSTCHTAETGHGGHASTAVTPVSFAQTDGRTFGVRAVSCVSAGCHPQAEVTTAAFRGSCAGCHASNVDSHAAATADHSYSAASDYSESTQTGCSNSGVGCHGSDTGYADIRASYGHDGCTSGPCHTSTSKSNVTAKLECLKCHSGGYAGAPNRASLGGAYPNGHYSETTHTAAAMGRVVSAGGTASAACSSCHVSSLRSSHSTVTTTAYGNSITCYECHNDTRVGGSAQVLGDWAARTCEACHTSGSTVPMHSAAAAPVVTATVSGGCAATGCHSTDLHQVHKDGASCGLAGCHTAVGVVPTQKTCGSTGSCHPTAPPGHKPHQTVTTRLTTDATWKAACDSCHGTSHSNATCGSCHAPTKTRDVHKVGVHMESNTTCRSCHNVATADTSLNCRGCHPNGTKPSYGTVSGVTRTHTGAALAGVTVSIGSASTVTDSSGRYSLSGVLSGTASLTAAKTGFLTTSQSVSVPASGTVASDVTMWSSTATGTLTGTVTDSASGAPLAGVGVARSGGGAATTDANGRYTMSGVLNGPATLTLTKSGYNSRTLAVTVYPGVSTAANTTLVLAAVNHARSSTASASSSVSTTYSPSKAVDGSTSTYWRSTAAATQWLRLDLGSAKAVGRVVVNWNDSTYFAKGYRIETSADGVTWTSRYSTTSASSGTKTHTFTGVNARYVRLYLTTGNSTDYRVREFEVWSY